MQQPDSKSWATHFRFLTLPEHAESFIPKQSIKTWRHLKLQLQRHVNIDYRNIDIAINGLKVFFAEDTLLEDVDIKDSDKCIVLVRRKYHLVKQKQQFKEYQKKVEDSIKKNRQQIEKKNNDPQFRAVMQRVNASQETKQIYSHLVKKYSKWQCLTAFNNCKQISKVQEYLASGKAKQLLWQKAEDDQRLQIDQFIKKDDIQELKIAILMGNSTPAKYEAVMRKILQKYPQFRNLQLRHKEYVYNQLTGNLEKEAKAVLEAVKQKRQPKYATEAEVEQFKKRCIQGGKRGGQVDEKIMLAGNNLAVAEQYLKNGKMNPSQNLTMCLNRTSSMNIVFQFFSHPLFCDLLPKLAQNVSKCQAFLEHILNKYKNNLILSTLITTYKQYIVTILSGVSVIEGQKGPQNKQSIEFTVQLSKQLQQAQKETIFAALNMPLVKVLTKYGVQQKLAISAVRAASNDVKKIEKYIWLGSVSKSYHFCHPSREEEQIYLQRHFKEEKKLLSKLKDKQEQALWLASIYETSPLLFNIIIRNKPFFDKLLEN